MTWFDFEQGHWLGSGPCLEDRARHLVGQDRPVSSPLGRIGDRHGVEQPLGVGVRGVLEDVSARSQLDDLAEIHHADSVGDPLHNGQIMADEQVRQPQFGLQVHHQVDDLRLNGDVQRRHRLVSDHQFGPQRQRSGDADPLTLAAGELMRILGHVLGRHADTAQQIGDDIVDFAPGNRTVNLQRLCDCLADGAAGIEAGKRVLEDDLDLAPMRAQRFGSKIGDVGAVEPDRAACGIEQADDQVRERRLAASTLADNGEGLAPIDVQADVLDRVHAGSVSCGKVLGQGLHFHDRPRVVPHGHGNTPPSPPVPPAAEGSRAPGSMRSKRCGASRPAIEPSLGTAASSERV